MANHTRTISNAVKPKLRVKTAGPSPLVQRERLDGAAALLRPVSRRMHRRETAVYLGVSLSWLDKSRMTGTGPIYITIGGRVVYDLADLEAFLNSNRRTQISCQQL